RLSATMIGRDNVFASLLNANRIDVVFENAQYFGWRLGVPVIAWIPDLQHRHIPSMFGFRNYWRREIGFWLQIWTRQRILVSSEAVRKDCEALYPRMRGRAWVAPFAVPTPSVLGTPNAVVQKYGLP